MNEAPSNQSGLSDTFSSQPAPQTNPFTADLKGEFTSNFGTNTNVPQQSFQRKWQFKDDLSIMAGKHSLKFGGDYRHINDQDRKSTRLNSSHT